MLLLIVCAVHPGISINTARLSARDTGERLQWYRITSPTYEHYSERLADQEMDPTSDGNFNQIGYGVILAESTYSIDHVVTQEDIDNGDYSYEVGTQIMTLSLVDAKADAEEN